MINVRTLTFKNAKFHSAIDLTQFMPNLKEVRILWDRYYDIADIHGLDLFGGALKEFPLSKTIDDYDYDGFVHDVINHNDPPLDYLYNLPDVHVDVQYGSKQRYNLYPEDVEEILKPFKSLKSCSLKMNTNLLPRSHLDKIVSLTLDAPNLNCVILQHLGKFTALKKLVLNVQICGCVANHYNSVNNTLESFAISLSDKHCPNCIQSIITLAKNLKFLEVTFTRLGNTDQLRWLRHVKNLTEFKMDLFGVLQDTTQVYKNLTHMNGLTSLKLKLRNMFDICCFIYAMPKLSRVKELHLSFKCPLTTMEILKKIEEACPIVENLEIALHDNAAQQGLDLTEIADCFPKNIKTISIPPICPIMINVACSILAKMFRSHLKLNWIKIDGKSIARSDIERCDPPSSDGFSVTNYHWHVIRILLNICSYELKAKPTVKTIKTIPPSKGSHFQEV